MFDSLKIEELILDVHHNKIDDISFINNFLNNQNLKKLTINADSNQISNIKPIETSLITWSNNNPEKLTLAMSNNKFSEIEKANIDRFKKIILENLIGKEVEFNY